MERQKLARTVVPLKWRNASRDPDNDSKMVLIVPEIKRLASFALLTVLVF